MILIFFGNLLLFNNFYAIDYYRSIWVNENRNGSVLHIMVEVHYISLKHDNLEQDYYFFDSTRNLRIV